MPAQLSTLHQKYRFRPWAYWLRYFAEFPETLLSVILVGNTLANLGVTLLLFYLSREVEHPYAEAIAAFVALGLLIFFGEIIPKSLALLRPLIFLRIGTPLVQVVFWFSYPVGRLLDRIRLTIERRWSPQTSPEELTRVVDTLPSDLSPPTEKRVLKNLLLLRRLPVKAFMLSRMDMRGVPFSLKWEELKRALAEIPYIRVPVYKESLDEIHGILLVKDLLPHWQKPEVINWQALIRPAYFVPETKNAYELLLELKNRRQHVAIVVDEFGTVAGLVSLQRLLEVVFGYGEEDEKPTQALYQGEKDGTVCFQAHVPLVVVQELLNLPADFFAEEEARNAENLADFLLSLAEHIPTQGEVLTYRDYAFEVVESSPHRIERVRAYRSLRRDDLAPSEDIPSPSPA